MMSLVLFRFSQVSDSVCGIVGFVQPDGFSAPAARSVLSAMSAAIAHRGPDDDGVWLDVGAGVALAHRRLAVIDLSAAGHQPMCSSSGRYVIVFNGEIYNHAEIRKQVDARFSTASLVDWQFRYGGVAGSD